MTDKKIATLMEDNLRKNGAKILAKFNDRYLVKTEDDRYYFGYIETIDCVGLEVCQSKASIVKELQHCLDNIKTTRKNVRNKLLFAPVRFRSKVGKYYKNEIDIRLECLKILKKEGA